MKIEVKVPSVGESVSTADIESWEKQPGDLVQKGEILVILETDKASMEIPAEQKGQLEILKQKGEQVSVGEVIALIETTVESVKKAGHQEPFEKASTLFKGSHSDQIRKPSSTGPSEDSKSSKTTDFSLENFSPAVRHLLAGRSINPSQIKGTGRGGRLTKEDVLNYLDELKSSNHPNVLDSGLSHSDALHSNSSSKQIPSSNTTQSLKTDQRRGSMTRLRRVTAERLVQSQQSTATLTTFNEVDLSRIIEIRKNYQEDFIKKYGFKLGFMSFFVKAVVVALKEFPKINAFIEEEDIIYNDSQHIGIAVSTEKGLVVPVLFHAEKMSLSQIEKKIIEYRDKALSRKLSPDDLLGGTFTISNGGVFGSLLSTPILNPPQSGILGMHKIEQRPVVRKGKIEIRPMMYLALSYDHRMVDGRESVSFLVKVREGLEEPSRLLIDI